MYDWETFQTAYHSASPELRAIVDSEAIGSCCRSVVENEQLDNSHYSKLVKLQALIILGFLERDRAIFEMRALGIPKTELVYVALQTCVANYQPEPDREELTRSIEDVETALKTITSPNYQSRPKTTPEIVHRSTQDNLLIKPEARRSDGGL